MFIKILTPNHNGKIELTVRDLEALIQEAVDKAVREKCAGCTRPYYGGITCFGSENGQLNNINLSCTAHSDSNDPVGPNGARGIKNICDAYNITKTDPFVDKINEIIYGGEKR